MISKIERENLELGKEHLDLERYEKIRDSDLFDEREEVITQEGNLKIIETFSRSDNNILEKVRKKQIESPEIMELRKKSEETAILSGINKLISYEMIKSNLFYNLPHQQENALCEVIN